MRRGYMPSSDFTKTAFNAYLAEHKLMGSTCTSCGTKFLPPRPLCTNCFGEEMVWEEVEGEGELTAFTTIHIAPTAMLDAGYGRDKPYCSGIVTLKNGLSISAQIVGVDASDPESIKIGSPVTVEFIERGEEEAETFLAFRVK
jgi:uncharacterized OB-fold protein